MGEQAMVFGAKRVNRLTGVSVRQLGYWDATDFYRPSYEDGIPGHTSTRFYSFRDLVALRTIHQIRKRVSLPRLRELGQHIKEAHDTPWASLRFYLAGDGIVWLDPRNQAAFSDRPHEQRAMLVSVEEVANDISERIRSAKRRSEDVGKIVPKAHKRGLIQGTAIPAAVVWDYHVEGYSTDRIIGQFPQLTPDDVAAAIAFERQRRNLVA